MLFKLFFQLLKNIRWLLGIVILVLFISLAATKYSTLKETPLGQYLPDISLTDWTHLLPQKNDTATDSSHLPDTISLTITKSSGQTISFTTEVAQTEEQRTLGLMHRSSLPTYGGMFFVFPADSMAGFWMKNCEISLDMLFIDEQMKIVDIVHRAQPCSEIDPKQEQCPIYNSRYPYRYVLEIKGGTAERNEITLGNIVSIDEPPQK